MPETGVFVSVVVLAHNHERYIKKSIDSVLNQKTSFPIEVLILEDGSSDNTKELILTNYSHCDRVVPLFSDRNRGAGRSSLRLLSRNLGKYIALLDGDDHWTFEGKLEEQVMFLEKNHGYSGAFHDATFNHQTNTYSDNLYISFKRYSQMYKYNQDYYPWDALNRVIIPSSSLVFKASLLSSLKPDSMVRHVLSGGWMFTVLLLRHGKFRYFNEEWSVYLNHDSGITKQIDSSRFNIASINFLRELLKDDYYKNIKKDVYKSITTEAGNLLHCQSLRNESWLIRVRFLLLFACSFFIWGGLEVAERYQKQFQCAE